jgi:hypothetical protein
MHSFPFSKNLFWDCDPSDISLEKNKRFVIERVLTHGQLSDFKTLLTLYSQDDIRSAIVKSKELDPKTAHFCSWYFKIPEAELHVSPFHS